MCLIVYLDGISGYIEPGEFGRYSKKQDLMEIKTIARVQLSLALNNIRRIR
jgi:hypothetical protein